VDSITVLTIDDNDTIRLSISSFLEDLGYNVIDANSGESGIEIIKNNHVDVVLTDALMPGISGIEVLEFVKNNFPELPVIIISGAGEIKYAIEALRSGAWNYITKPIEDLSFLSYSIEEVLKKVRLINENRVKSREIENKNIELNEALEKLKNTQKQLVESEKMASLGYMLNGVAHEINTPLGVCLTSSSFIKENSKEINNLIESNKMTLKDFKKYISNSSDLSNIIFDSLQTINNLVTNFKQLSVESMDYNKKWFNLNDNIRSVVMFVASSYHNMQVDIDITGVDLDVEYYSDIINRIFIKLAENSIIHGFESRVSGKIEVNIKIENSLLIIDFYNNGKQIPEDYIGKIFDPFFSTNKKKGTGLGLCIAYNLIVFSLRGNITCQNKNYGVNFTIEIPMDNLLYRVK